MSDNALNDVIRDHAMLVSVHIKHWSASVKDREAERAAAEKSGAEPGAYRTLKNLMHKNDQRLKKVAAEGNALRALHKERTMSWDSGRSPFRMLPVLTFQSYTTAIAKAKASYDAALQDFLDHYDEDARKARAALNIDETDGRYLRVYPRLDDLPAKFGVFLEFEPIPKGSMFRNIPESAAAALNKKFEDKVAARYHDALREHVTELLHNLTHLREALQTHIIEDEAQRWRNASVYNPVQKASMLPSFDLEGDQRLQDIADYAEKNLGRLSEAELTNLRKPDADRQPMIDKVAYLELMIENWLEE